MKKLFTIIAAATMFAACSSKSDLDTQKDVVITDTTNMYKSNASTDISIGQTNPATVAPQPQHQPQATRTIIREHIVYVDRKPKARKQTVHEATPADPIINVPQTQTNTNTNTSSTTGTSAEPGAGTASTGGAGAGTSTPTAEPVKKKEGWSNAAKDAVIGGASGAVLGAIISRKKGKGAVIGGIVGAAGGYIFGRKKDKATDNNNYANN